MTQFDDIAAAARRVHLTPLGVALEDDQQIVLLGPDEPGFWPYFQSQPEASDGAPDPLDRWSGRVISTLAESLGATPRFPFGGPPYEPFIGWALATGRIWQSPVTLLVHDQQGLMVSFRGALAFDQAIDGAPAGRKPCDTCPDHPCAHACPVDALDPSGYDAAACKAHVTSPAGVACRTGGCLARRACPVSQAYGRLEEQSAHHMEYFL